MTVSYNPGDLVRMMVTEDQGSSGGNRYFWYEGCLGRLVARSTHYSDVWLIEFHKGVGAVQEMMVPSSTPGGGWQSSLRTTGTRESNFTLFARGGGPDDPYKE